MGEVEQKIRTFVIDNLLFGQGGDSFSNDDSFLERRLIDSMGVLSLVEFVGETFAVPIDDSEIVPENWDSVSLITRFIQAKLGSVAS